MRRIEVEWVNASCVYVRGHGSRELLTSIIGRPPVWAARAGAWVCQPRAARDAIAVAESRGWSVDIIEPGTDPGRGRW
jgi:hypothetical protein